VKWIKEGKVPLQTIGAAKIDHCSYTFGTTYGILDLTTTTLQIQKL
jgi:ribosomal protein S3